MTERTKTAFKLLKAAAFLGIFGDILLRQTPWGLNAFLFVAAFAAALVVLTKLRRPELLTIERLALVGAMVFFGSMFVVRDSIELRVYDTFTIIGIMGVISLGALGIRVRIAGAFHYICGFFWSALSSVLAPVVVLGADVEWKSLPGTQASRRVFSILRGIAIALPLILIFGALFSSADARFEAWVNSIIYFDLGTVISHILLTAGLAWLCAGYFRGSIITPGFAAGRSHLMRDDVKSEDRPAVDRDVQSASYFDQAAAEPTTAGVTLPDNATVLEHINRSDPPNKDDVGPACSITKKRDWQDLDSSSLPTVFTLGTIETVIVLGLVDLLFLSFVLFQLPYLFGGMELVQNTPDFKLADYARRGFGELVAVAALVLPMLLFSHWLLRSGTKRLVTIFRALAAVQIALVFIVMASAVQRLILLTGEAGYGLTTVRFYPMVFMIWLSVIFVWFGATVLRGARDKFAWGALWSAIILLAATNLMNPDAFIARTNIALMHNGRDFDAYYNVSALSADAVPEILSALSTMPIDPQCQAKFDLHIKYWDLGKEGDLRSLNYSRKSAFYQLRNNDALLHQRDGCPAWMQLHESGE
jgi:hypothetical protein